MMFKPGVVMWDMHPAIESVASTIDLVSKRVAGRPAIVTSARDGEHSANSLHYKGKAIDLRTKDLQRGVASLYAAELQRILGSDYDVVLESTHIHVEYDP